MYYVRPDSSYYEFHPGDKVMPGDVEVPRRPSPYHTWNGSEWRADIEAAKQKKILELSAQTRDYIIMDSPLPKRMPAWRQTRFNEFCAYHERVLSGGILSLREQLIYDGMMNDPNTTSGTTAQDIYNSCMAAIQWVHDCLAAQAATEAQIKTLTDIVAINEFDVTTCYYPAWIGV